jgi:hypothetical protein
MEESMNVAQQIIVWITANWDAVLQIWLQIIGIASLIVKVTPTLKDDDVLKNVIRFVGKYIALNHTTTPTK